MVIGTKNMKIRKTVWIMDWVGIVILIVVPASFGDAQDELYGFHPYIILQEEYNDNINLTQDNTKGDFITSVNPGLKYKAGGGVNKFELDYMVGLNFYASESQKNYVSHQGRLSTLYSFNPRWTFTLDDTLIRSREGIESYTVTSPTGNQTTVDSSSSRSLYLRNNFDTGLDYKFGEANLVGLQYHNMIYRVDEGTGEESTENSITSRLAYWFNIRNGIILNYTYSMADFANQPDWEGNTVTVEYNYRFNPRTRVFGTYSFSIKDLKEPGIDYSVHSPSIRVEHAFNPNLKGQAGLGWFWQIMETDTGHSFNGPTYNLSITQSSLRTDYNLTLSGGYQEEYFTADNLGFSRSNNIQANVTHRFTERVSAGLSGILGLHEYQNPDRKDWIWGLTGDFSYKPLKWLTVSLQASTRTRDSDLSGNSYQENRVLFRIRAEY
jgi:hypothetical protein